MNQNIKNFIPQDKYGYKMVKTSDLEDLDTISSKLKELVK